MSSINHYALASKNKRQGRTTGYAYVKKGDRVDRRHFFRFLHFPNDEEAERAERAERALSGTMFCRRPLLVREDPSHAPARRPLIGSRISFILDRSRSVSFQGCRECFYSTTCECYRRSKGRIPKRNGVSRAGGTIHRGT